LIKIFESFDFSRVGRLQSLLESRGIPTYMRNQFASSVMGEVPFVEVCPQLFILDDGDLELAQRLLLLDLPANADSAEWQCPRCGLEIEGQFARCWNCAAPDSGSSFGSE
jgi:hypothetical protein